MYCKLFSSLYQGTLRGKAHEILVFTNLLAHCDAHGYVDKHWKAIAEEVGLTTAEVMVAIDALEAPDKDSRSHEEGGVRLLRMDGHRAWGWKVVNYEKYRSIRDEEDRRAQNRLSQKRFRDKGKESKHSKPPSAIVSQGKPMSAEGEGEAEGEVEKEILVNKNSEAPLLDAKAWEVVEYLNSRSGMAFRRMEGTMRPIRARLAEGVTVEECRSVIDAKVEEWGKDPKMRKYLRPETLFSVTKFPGYLGVAISAAQTPKMFTGHPQEYFSSPDYKGFNS